MIRRIYNLPRATGKSTRCMYLSEHYQAPVLYRSPIIKEIMEVRATNFDIDMPAALTIDDIINNAGKNIDKIIIDEPLQVLSVLIDKLVGHKVDIISMAFSNDGYDYDYDKE